MKTSMEKAEQMVERIEDGASNGIDRLGNHTRGFIDSLKTSDL